MGRRGIACCGIYTHHGGKSSAYLIAKSYFAHISCHLAHHQEHNKSRIQSCYFSSTLYRRVLKHHSRCMCLLCASMQIPKLCLRYNGQAYIKQHHTSSRRNLSSKLLHVMKWNLCCCLRPGVLFPHFRVYENNFFPFVVCSSLTIKSSASIIQSKWHLERLVCPLS